MMHLVFIAHVIATCVMAGVIWIVQLVHYPLFSMVGEGQWQSYHQAHMRLITYIVMPTMFVELIGAGVLCWMPLEEVGRPAFVVGLVLVLVAWGTTAISSVPHHTALAGGFDVDAHQALVATNWIRTVAWSARAGLMGWMMWMLMSASTSS